MLQGSMVALVTPVQNGQIDYASLKKLIDFQIQSGTDILVPCGTTGEAATMSHEEHRAMMDFVIDYAAGRVPVICGAGSNATEEAVGLVRHAKQAGAQGALVVVPYYNKPTQEGMFRHFEYIAKKVDLPIVLYNVPSRTGSSIAPDTVARLAKISNIVAIKEASGSIEQTSQILARCDITVISGEDGLTWPLMAVGAKGVISVSANIVPDRVKRMVHAALAGNAQEALKMHNELLEISRVLFIETNPIPVKTALAMMGMISEEFRLPLCPISAAARAQLQEVLQKKGVLNANAAGK